MDKKFIKQLWLIDNDPYFVARLRIAATVIGWEVIRLDSADPSNLPKHKPNLILLDRELARTTQRSRTLLDSWLAVLGEYKKFCYLITHSKEQESRILVDKYNLAGLLIKPLDVERIEEWSLSPTQNNIRTNRISDGQDGERYWQNYIQDISVPTIVLGQDFHLVAQNQAGSAAEIFSSKAPQAGAAPNAGTRRMLNLMLRELEPPLGQDRAVTDCAIRCEWEAVTKQWREWRLRSYPDKFAPGKYMLTFVTYSKNTDIIPLSRASHSNLIDYMDALARHLAELWGITRLRLYRVEELAGQKPSDAPDNYLLLPMLQFGGGLSTSKENWRQSVQLLADNQYASELLSAGQAELVIHDNRGTNGFPGVGFGIGTTRANMLIRDSDDLPVAMLSCDRRFDHFDRELNPEMAAREWDDPDNRHAQLAMQFVSDLGELSLSEAGRMQGLFHLVHEHLALILKRLTDERLGAWQRQITSIFTKRMDQSLRAKSSSGYHQQKMNAVCDAFGELRIAWQKGQTDVSNADPFCNLGETNQRGGGMHADNTLPSQLDSIYIADFISPSGFRSELGAGDVWALRNLQGVYWRAMPPHSQAIHIDDFRALVLQDFQKSNLSERPALDDTPLDLFLSGLRRYGLEGADLERARDSLRAIGSWAAIKMPQPTGEPWLLVAVGRRRHSWTRERVRWLRVLAERMAMLLRWWQAESQREWYRAAIAHELSKPMQYLEVSIQACREADKRNKFAPQLEGMQSLVQYHQHLVSNIQIIADGGASYASSSSGIAQISTTLREEWQRCAWVRAYCSTIDFDAVIEPLPAVQLRLPPSVLAQSMIILLINAHRYHYLPSDVKAQAELEVNDGQVFFRVRNAVTRPIPQSRYKDIFLPFFKLPGSAASGIGIGLAVLDALSRRYGMSCRVDNQKSDSADWRWQIFELQVNRSKS